jgi:hypothetical protein
MVNPLAVYDGALEALGYLFFHAHIHQVLNR